MITYLKINGFKSFHNFEMEFTPLTMIAGANASGKSNIFDALRLLARLAETDLKTAFNEQRGSANELFTQYGEEWHADEMEFVVEMLACRHIQDKWGGEADLKFTRLRYGLKIRRTINDKGFEDLTIADEYLERVKPENDRGVKNFIPESHKEYWWLNIGTRIKPYIQTEQTAQGAIVINILQDAGRGGKPRPVSSFQQTVLSRIDSVAFPHALAAKEEMRRWKFLQLNPMDLREPTRHDSGMSDTITPSGKNLAAALYRLKSDDEYTLKEISRALSQFLPNFTDVLVDDDKANQQFLIKLRGEDGREFSSRVLSEGTLRLLTLCIFQRDPQHTGLLCFEEPENGIHPCCLDTMARLLKDLSADFADVSSPLRQVIANTHSPVLVSQIIRWKDDPSVSVWFSKLVTLITDIEHPVISAERQQQRITMRVTKMLPVQKANHEHTTLKFSKEERKLTLKEIIRYLETSDAEKAIEEIR